MGSTSPHEALSSDQHYNETKEYIRSLGILQSLFLSVTNLTQCPAIRGRFFSAEFVGRFEKMRDGITPEHASPLILFPVRSLRFDPSTFPRYLCRNRLANYRQRLGEVCALPLHRRRPLGAALAHTRFRVSRRFPKWESFPIWDFARGASLAILRCGQNNRIVS